MSAFFYNGIPNYYMQGFRAVRGALDNLFNVLQAIEIVNCCQNYMIEPSDKDFDFDLAVFTGDYHRFLIKKKMVIFLWPFLFRLLLN